MSSLETWQLRGRSVIDKWPIRSTWNWFVLCLNQWDSMMELSLYAALKRDPQGMALHFYRNGEPHGDMQGREAFIASATSAFWTVSNVFLSLKQLLLNHPDNPHDQGLLRPQTPVLWHRMMLKSLWKMCYHLHCLTGMNYGMLFCINGWLTMDWLKGCWRSNLRTWRRFWGDHRHRISQMN